MRKHLVNVHRDFDQRDPDSFLNSWSTMDHFSSLRYQNLAYFSFKLFMNLLTFFFRGVTKISLPFSFILHAIYLKQILSTLKIFAYINSRHQTKRESYIFLSFENNYCTRLRDIICWLCKDIYYNDPYPFTSILSNVWQ